LTVLTAESSNQRYPLVSATSSPNAVPSGDTVTRSVTRPRIARGTASIGYSGNGLSSGLAAVVVTDAGVAGAATATEAGRRAGVRRGAGEIGSIAIRGCGCDCLDRARGGEWFGGEIVSKLAIGSCKIIVNWGAGGGVWVRVTGVGQGSTREGCGGITADGISTASLVNSGSATDGASMMTTVKTDGRPDKLTSVVVTEKASDISKPIAAT
jgi:hypothetical protein